MTQIHAYLHLAGSTREAMTFYQQCIGGELSVQTIGESPIAGQCPEAIQGQVMHASLVKGNLLLMASDMTGKEGVSKGNQISLALNCSSEEELHRVFDALSIGGNVVEKPGLQFWGDIFGALVDKFGTSWMLTYNTNTVISPASKNSYETANH